MTNTTAITNVSMAYASVDNTNERVAAPVAISIVFSNGQWCVQIGSSNDSWLVSSIGTEARRILQQSTIGSVLAVFQRSFYVQCDNGLICVGLASLGQGPLHVLLESDHDFLCENVTTGYEVHIRTITMPSYGDQWMSATGAQRAESFVMSGSADRSLGIVDSVENLKVPNVALTADPAIVADYSGQVLVNPSWRITKQHTLLLGACDAPASPSGFGWLLNKSCWRRRVGLKALSLDQLGALDRGLRIQSFAAVTALYGWLCGSSSSVSSDVQALLGAGPGLTPAGDDLLAGVMLALHRIDGGDRVAMLWQILQPAICARTNVISAAHLQLAARGQCAEPVLDLLDLYLVGSLPDSRSDILALAQDIQHLATRIGSSSGWDMLAGMSLVVRAFSDSSNY